MIEKDIDCGGICLEGALAYGSRCVDKNQLDYSGLER